ncbi:Unconventional Myosin-Viib [Manis pentadactyla]|nr:Unconventional Myosin-Viib [Manis pentadactyla]
MPARDGDIENQINKQLQDRLNQEEVATVPLVKELESGDRSVAGYPLSAVTPTFFQKGRRLYRTCPADHELNTGPRLFMSRV